MKQDNLNRIRGILSARQGTEIPKFDVGGPTVHKSYSWNGVPVTEEQFKELKAKSDAEIQQFRQKTGLGSRLNIRRLQSDPVSTTVNNPIVDNTVQNTTVEKNTTPTTVNNAPAELNKQQDDEPVETVLRTEIPGALQATPYTAAENAAKHNEISRQKVDEMIAEQRAASVELPEINVTATNPNQGVKVTPLTTSDPPKIDVSAGMQRVQKHIQQLDDEAVKNAAKIEQRNNTLGQIGNGLSQGIQAVGNAFGAAQAATDSNLTKGLDAGFDATADIASQFGPIGQAIGGAMKIAGAAGDIIQGITGGNDQMTAADKVLSSSWLSWTPVSAINDLFGKESDAFATDVEALETVGSSYGGTANDISETASKAGKKYGLFSSGARKRANEAAKQVAAKQGLMSNIADTARDQRLAVQSMGEQAGLAYSMMIDGGYNQKYTYAAKHGGLLEWNPVIELEWEPQVELNWELPTFKEGGSVEFVEELEWIPEFKDGGKTEESDIPETEETTQKNVIPEGALHKNKHHMEHAEGLTKKGIPVVDEDGEQQAEIEHSEIIFTLEVTKKLEEYYEIFYSEDSTNKEKEQAALNAGKLLVYQILENTEDRTGLIDSCKKGGSLTLKKSTDDLIEEVLEWMPTIVVVETEEPEESKEDKPKKKDVDTSKEELKQMIKEVLVELLIK